MSINITLGDSELEIMKILWKATNPITSVEIGEAVSYRSWKKTTISTFLTRLTEKRAISAKKQGKLYYYTALISEKEYRKSQTKNLITSLYHGSVKELAVSLFEEEKMSAEDIEELRSVFKEWEEK